MASPFDDAVLLWNPGEDGGRSSDLVTDTESDVALTEGTWTDDEGFAGRVYSGATGSRFTVSQASLAPHTIMFLLKRNAVGNQWGGLATSSQNLRYAQVGVETNQWHVVARNGNAGNWPNVYSTTNLDTSLHVLVSRYTGASRIEMWLDGVFEGFESENTGASAGTLDRFTVGRLDRSSAVNSTNVSVYAAAFWDRELTDDEIGEISDTPRDYLSPTQPTSPAAVATGMTTIDVTWTDSLRETGYRVERSADGTAGWTNVSGSLAADDTDYTDTGLTANTTYYYRIVAFNAVGDSDPSTVVSATTFDDFNADVPPYTKYRFMRSATGTLSLVETHDRITQGGWSTLAGGEAFEQVSDRFRVNRAVDREAVMAAVATAWAAHSGSAAATLEAAIHADLNARGVLRYDGTSLV